MDHGQYPLVITVTWLLKPWASRYFVSFPIKYGDVPSFCMFTRAPRYPLYTHDKPSGKLIKSHAKSPCFNIFQRSENHHFPWKSHEISIKAPFSHGFPLVLASHLPIPRPVPLIFEAFDGDLMVMKKSDSTRCLGDLNWLVLWNIFCFSIYWE